jgi:hypothetical protein
MTIRLHADDVRQIVVRIFEAIAGRMHRRADINETILVDGGKYAGRTYRCRGLMAMWMLDVGVLQFYDHDGNMLRTINLLEEQVPQRAVA